MICYRRLTFFVGVTLLCFQDSAGRYIENDPDFQDVANLRIVSGSDVTRGDWPWQALIMVKARNRATLTICGGTLIAEDWVMTAASCMEGHLKTRVYFGVWNVTNRIEVGRDISKVKRVYAHPCYDGSQGAALSGFNIALLRLTTKIYRFQNACLEGSGHHDWKELKNGETLGGCVALGYGVTDNGELAKILQKAELSTVSMATCEPYDGITPSKTKIFCGRDDEVTGRDTCKGDTGGPLVCPTSKQGCKGYYPAGITLPRFSNCGEKPGLYAAVHPNLPWIKTVLGGGSARRDNEAYHCADNERTVKATRSRNSLSKPKASIIQVLNLKSRNIRSHVPNAGYS